MKLALSDYSFTHVFNDTIIICGVSLKILSQGIQVTDGFENDIPSDGKHFHQCEKVSQKFDLVVSFCQ